MAAAALIPDRVTVAGDEESRRWLADLTSAGHRREQAQRRLYALLLKAADFEVSRRAPALGISDRAAMEDLTAQAAGDAMVSILRKLHTFRGQSRFTTWAYKFALYEAAAKTRRRAWRDREIPLADADWAGRASLHHDAETAELLHVIARGIEERLTTHQREVLLAIAVEGVPIDVLAERRHTTRGALYKTLHDARRALRGYLQDHDLSPTP